MFKYNSKFYNNIYNISKLRYSSYQAQECAWARHWLAWSSSCSSPPCYKPSTSAWQIKRTLRVWSQDMASTCRPSTISWWRRIDNMLLFGAMYYWMSVDVIRQKTHLFVRRRTTLNGCGDFVLNE